MIEDDRDEDQIRNMKQNKFKKLVEERIDMKASEFLDQCLAKHSKTSNLKTYKFQEYQLLISKQVKKCFFSHY